MEGDLIGIITGVWKDFDKGDNRPILSNDTVSIRRKLSNLKKSHVYSNKSFCQKAEFYQEQQSNRDGRLADNDDPGFDTAIFSPPPQAILATTRP